MSNNDIKKLKTRVLTQKFATRWQTYKKKKKNKNKNEKRLKNAKIQKKIQCWVNTCSQSNEIKKKKIAIKKQLVSLNTPTNVSTTMYEHSKRDIKSHCYCEISQFKIENSNGRCWWNENHINCSFKSINKSYQQHETQTNCFWN